MLSFFPILISFFLSLSPTLSAGCGAHTGRVQCVPAADPARAVHLCQDLAALCQVRDTAEERGRRTPHAGHGSWSLPEGEALQGIHRIGTAGIYMFYFCVCVCVCVCVCIDVLYIYVSFICVCV